MKDVSSIYFIDGIEPVVLFRLDIIFDIQVVIHLCLITMINKGLVHDRSGNSVIIIMT